MPESAQRPEPGAPGDGAALLESVAMPRAHRPLDTPAARRFHPLAGACGSLLRALTAGALAACAPKVAPRTERPAEAIPRTTVPAVVGVQPGILSAQHRDPTLADHEDGRTIAAVIYLVLSVEVDPTTIDPESFVVALDDGRRRRPSRVMLTAGSGRHENRTLILALDQPEGAEPVRPLALTITGPLFGEGGEPLSGLAAEIDPLEGPPRLVFAVREVAEEGACAGSKQAVRTFWSVPVAGGEALEPAGVAVTLDDGSVVHPSAVDDHRLGVGALQTDDNVLVLCVDAPTPAKRVAVDGDLLRDHYGLASAAGEVSVVRAPRI